MRKLIVNANREDAREHALSLLFGKDSEGKSLHFTEDTRHAIQYEENHTLLDEATGNYQKGEELYSIITDEETGAKVLFFHVPTTKEDYYRVVYFAPEEWGRYTIPFKNLPEESLFIPVVLNACFVKPVKPLSPDEALTASFAKAIDQYFENVETPYTKEDYLSKGYSLSTAFEVEDDEVEENPKKYKEEYKRNLIFTAYASPSILTELSGVRIKSRTDYAKALKKSLNAPTLDERQERAVEESLNFELGDLFLKWLIYEFLRTEDYNHLKECLKEYKKFLLPKEWAKSLIYLNVEPEEYVISKYLSRDAIRLLQRDQLRDLSTATNTPLSLILKASKRNIWDF